MTTRGVLSVGTLLVALTAGGAVEAAPSASPAPTQPPAAQPPPAAQVSVPGARNTLERGVTELGTLLARARQSGNMTRVACVQDKRDRADSILEVATGEILLLQDPSVDAQSRAFAGEKLAEAADRLSGLVSQARACQGGGDEDRKAADNQANQPKTVIPSDPTSSVPSTPRLPPRIDPRPPVASPIL